MDGYLDVFIVGSRKYLDIITVTNFYSIKVANMELIYWSVRSSSRRGGEWVSLSFN